MIQVSVKIENLDKLQRAFNQAPSKTIELLKKAVNASIAEIDKEAIDRNFQFRLPRGRRTGQLERSFAYGRKFASDGLSGSIGPTVQYAPYVYFGTKKGIRPNQFMDRIAKAAEPKINEHFNIAVDLLAKHLALK